MISSSPSSQNHLITYLPFTILYMCICMYTCMCVFHTNQTRNLIKKLERSCSVNRTVRLSSDVTKERQRGPHEEDQTPIYEEFFESFMIHKFFRNQPPLPVDPLKNWNPKDEIDKGTMTDMMDVHTYIDTHTTPRNHLLVGFFLLSFLVILPCPHHLYVLSAYYAWCAF